MARRMLSVLLSIVVAIIVVGFFLPRDVVVQRSQLIETSPDVVFAVLNDLRYFSEWSPWYARDPDAGYRLEGPQAGVGATLAWSDEGGSGAGRLWITAASPPDLIELRMELGETESENFFRLQSAQGNTEVTWGMRMQFGVFDLTGRYIGLMLPGLVGGDFSQGLERLKDYLEGNGGNLPPPPDRLEVSDFPTRSLD